MTKQQTADKLIRERKLSLDNINKELRKQFGSGYRKGDLGRRRIKVLNLPTRPKKERMKHVRKEPRPITKPKPIPKPKPAPKPEFPITRGKGKFIRGVFKPGKKTIIPSETMYQYREYHYILDYVIVDKDGNFTTKTITISRDDLVSINTILSEGLQIIYNNIDEYEEQFIEGSLEFIHVYKRGD